MVAKVVHNTVVTPLLTHWSHYSLVLSYWNIAALLLRGTCLNKHRKSIYTWDTSECGISPQLQKHSSNYFYHQHRDPLGRWMDLFGTRLPVLKYHPHKLGATQVVYEAKVWDIFIEYCGKSDLIMMRTGWYIHIWIIYSKHVIYKTFRERQHPRPAEIIKCEH